MHFYILSFWGFLFIFFLEINMSNNQDWPKLHPDTGAADTTHMAGLF